MSDLVRFSVAMPEDLMQALDAYAVRRGTRKNRSEAIRDLVREALIDEQVEDPMSEVVATLTMVFDHHAGDLRDTLDEIQHAHCEAIVSTTHVHLDPRNCLEVTILRGKSWVVRTIANTLLGTKGVLHGQLVVTAVNAPAEHGGHDDGHEVHDHAHPHTHVDAHGHEYTHTH